MKYSLEKSLAKGGLPIILTIFGNLVISIVDNRNINLSDTLIWNIIIFSYAIYLIINNWFKNRMKKI